MKILFVVMSLLTSTASFAMPGAEDKIDCQAEAKAIVRSILRVQEGRRDIDAVSTGSWGTKDGGEAGLIVWFDFKGIIVDGNGKKLKDLDQAYSEVTFVTSKGSNKCVLTSYSIPDAN